MAVARVGGLAVLSSATLLQAQLNRGVIEGFVTGPQGAVVPEVEVVVTAVDTNVEQTTKTNGAGYYRVVPHWYESVTNDFQGLKRWGSEFLCSLLEPGRGYGTPVLLAGPYLTGEGSHASNAPEPLYIADWYVVPGHPEFDHQFFNFVAEVRDGAGYEWSPSHVSTEEAVRRGIEETQREFDSMLPAVLFSHESDHIMYLEPEEWDRILKGALDGLKQYEPIPVAWEFEAVSTSAH
jgi:hypothetical protein